MLVAYCSTTFPFRDIQQNHQWTLLQLQDVYVLVYGEEQPLMDRRELAGPGAGRQRRHAISLPIKIGGAGSPSAWLRYTTSFDLAKNYTGSITVKIENTAKNDEFLLFDDITVRLCGEKCPRTPSI